MKFHLFSFVVLFATALGSLAEARSSSGVLLTANAFMYNSTVEDDSTSSDSKTAIYDIKLGYLQGNGFYLGGIYTKRDQSGSSDADGSAMGASIGYFGASGFFLKGHYLVSAENGNLKEGSGFQGDFGYISEVSSSVIVGVELTYRSIEYKETNGADSKTKVSELFPMLTVGFVF
ncbi:hypothetical protein AZI87_12780 [Bdellovibrio bacteriovorus]|uniref:Outer membrane protein beta-barrel domain-containing protein n=1 Tax=Bdellovibrio bacteriovorus TaxID=959 RepID=A0A162GA50_BDEBC|nr:hypothetical protein [Bdellovibrio bacteriovorus]KYG65411.1 hypothetical protein AZI87_12780 [Bdellovibrio bacteriovorus]